MKELVYIKAEDLKDGYLYEIDARNANRGIWWKKNGSFAISRFKLGDNFLFEEIHYDLDDWHGTAKPIKEIEKSPFNPEIDFKLMDIIGEDGKEYWGYNKEEDILKYLAKMGVEHERQMPEMRKRNRI